ncbi:MAG: PilZ domain-containing protein [Hyphomonas sp.]|nr:PilZ domain-containing protein [Hyphomonas sp.]
MAEAKRTDDELGASAENGAERRRFPRLDLRLQGRFLTEFDEDEAFEARDMSCTSAHIAATHRPEHGALVICYFDFLGRIVGTVDRHTEDGFIILFDMARHKAARIAEKLEILTGAGSMQSHERRESDRADWDGPARVLRENGQILSCRILDFSLTGASFECAGPMPAVNEIVTAGHIPAKVVRIGDGGFAVRYLQKAEREELEARRTSIDPPQA